MPRGRTMTEKEWQELGKCRFKMIRHDSFVSRIGTINYIILFEQLLFNLLGVQQSGGWVHYMIHEPEPHLLLFRRE